jgi:hypothetical protein
MEKLGIGSLAELVRLAEKAGIEPAQVPSLKDDEYKNFMSKWRNILNLTFS